MKLSRGLAAALACWLWLAACCGVVGWRFVQGLPVDTDIQSMLPSGGGDAVERAAISRASQAAAGRTAVLVSAADEQTAQAAASDLEADLAATGIFSPDRQDVEATGRWLFANRNELLCQSDPARFTADEGKRTARRALADVYSVSGPVTGDLLRQDPFLLTIRLAECLSPVGAAQPSGTTRLVSGRISTSAFRLDAQASVIKTFNDWKAEWAPKGVSAARAGAVFHADAAASSATADMTLIGALSSIGVVLLFFAAYRTIRSAVQAMVLVAIGLAAGLGATLALFPTVHVLVFVFAAMLVGIVSDYAVHTLASGPATNWAGTHQRIELVGRPITVSMATAVIGFGSLALFGVPLFQQVALLSGVGIATAWAFVLWVLVPMDKRPKNADALRAWWIKLEDMRERVKIPAAVAWTSAVLLALVSIYGAVKLSYLDDVRAFQPRPADLVAEEEQVRAAGYAGSGVTFLLSEGASAQEARQREEAALAQAPEPARLLATTRFDPSQQRRAANSAALQTNLYQPLLAEHVANVGLDPAEAATPPPISADPPSWMADLGGDVDGKRYLIAPLLDPAGWTGPTTEGVRLIDPAVRYSDAFRTYREHALIALAVAAICAVGATLLVYRRLAALSILAPPLLACAVALLAPPALGFPLTFFSFAAALVLLGIGIDYAAFQWEAGLQHDRWTAVAVFIDAVTTLLSMGLLILSSTYPVRSFGLTVTIGIAAALCLSHIPRLVAMRVGRTGKA